MRHVRSAPPLSSKRSPAFFGPYEHPLGCASLTTSLQTAASSVIATGHRLPPLWQKPSYRNIRLPIRAVVVVGPLHVRSKLSARGLRLEGTGHRARRTMGETISCRRPPG